MVGLDDVVDGAVGVSSHEPGTPATDPTGTFCNGSWDAFFQQSGIKPSELWDEHEQVGAELVPPSPLIHHPPPSSSLLLPPPPGLFAGPSQQVMDEAILAM